MSVNAAVFPVPGNCSQFQYNMLDLGRQPGFSKWEPGSYLVNENFVPGPRKLSSQFLYNMLYLGKQPGSSSRMSAHHRTDHNTSQNR